MASVKVARLTLTCTAAVAAIGILAAGPAVMDISASARVTPPSRVSLPSLVVPVVIGGKVAQTSYPFQVALLSSHTNVGQEFKGFYCGGSLIDSQWVLTAAHCIVNEGHITPGSEIDVYIGSNNFEGGDRISGAIAYPHYQYDPAKLFDNDIALVRLQRPPKSGTNFSTIGIEEDAKWFFAGTGQDTAVRLVGWGRTRLTEGPSKDLREIDLYVNMYCEIDYRVWARRQLEQTLRKRFRIGNEKINRMMAAFDADPHEDALPPGAICASKNMNSISIAQIGASIEGPCKGDSGGPLFRTEQNGKRIQVGIVSWGLACENDAAPAVFTNVGYYAEWIKGSIRSGDETVKAFSTKSK